MKQRTIRQFSFKLFFFLKIMTFFFTSQIFRSIWQNSHFTKKKIKSEENKNSFYQNMTQYRPNFIQFVYGFYEAQTNKFVKTIKFVDLLLYYNKLVFFLISLHSTDLNWFLICSIIFIDKNTFYASCWLNWKKVGRKMSKTVSFVSLERMQILDKNRT